MKENEQQVDIKAQAMPDVASDPLNDTSSNYGQLQKVGMENVDLPVLISGLAAKPLQVPAQADFFVNLAKEGVRGIHMSRLYLIANKILGEEVIKPSTLNKLLQQFVDSHEGLSQKSYTCIRFNYLTQRKALLSDNSGWRSYPVEICNRFEGGKFKLDVNIQVIYSSTCPCSASLARQVIQNNFKNTFPEGLIETSEVQRWLSSNKGINATPHSQRSIANVRLQFSDQKDDFDFEGMINIIENALQTPVQGPVKREDEQEFARLNGENPMFCEDAARKIKTTLELQKHILDYKIKVNHLESLHPFDAVAVAVKEVEGGYRV